jgi:hypothetical protein
MTNPFKPSFGTYPPILIGRDGILDEFRYGLKTGPGDPNRAVVFTGSRGIGKSVMLSELADIASEAGFVTVRINSLDNLLKEVIDRILINASEVLGKKTRKLASLTLPFVGGGVAFENDEDYQFGESVQLEQLAKQIDTAGSGLFIAMDEIHYSNINELRQFFSSYQTLVSQGLNVAIAVAGLPRSVSDILNDDLLTFLRRATQIVLADVAIKDVEQAFEETITKNGRAISKKNLSTVAVATCGYPFMIQLVGYHVWLQNEDKVQISSKDVKIGIQAAKRRLGSTIHAVSLNDLSNVDRTFLTYMAMSDTPVAVSKIAEKMQVSGSYVSQYRKRLIEAGIIVPIAHGEIDFAIPYIKDYLREHIASDYIEINRS